MFASLRLRAVQSPIIPVIADLIRSCPGTLSLGQGIVGYNPPPAALAQIEQFLAEPTNHRYQSVAGIPPLVARIIEKLTAENGLVFGGSDEPRVMVTAGGNNAFIAAVLAIADPGDEIILPTPYYFNHEMAIVMANAHPVLVPTDADYQLDVAALRAAITPRTRAIITVSPNNPSGAVYPEATLRAVNALCAEHGLWHISDEAYEAFTYEGAIHFSPGSIPGSDAHTISLYSMSKAYGFASWRVGWMVFPQKLASALRKIQDTLIICPPVISQFAALGALTTDADYLRGHLRDLTAVRAIVRRALTALETAGIAEIPVAQGAFYFLLRLRAGQTPLTSLEIATRLIREHGVAVIPGSAFGLNQGGHLRVAYGALSYESATEGIGRLVRGLHAIAD